MALFKFDDVVGVSKLTTPGQIYFIQAVDGGLVKIGWATCPATRMARMQPHCPVTLRLLYSEPGNGRDEMALHQKFAAARQHGEWFEPTAELLDYIRTLATANAKPEYAPAPAARPRTIARRIVAESRHL